MKYKFIQIEPDGAKIIHTFECEDLSEMLLRIRYFLQGCSFVFYPGQEIVLTERSKDGPSPD